MKKVLYIVVLVISLYIINHLSHSIYNLSQKKNLVTDTREELAEEKLRYDTLKDQLTRVKRQDFVEEEARNKLFLVKAGENIVILPSPTISPDEANNNDKKNLPVWKQWIEVFFGA